MTKVTFNHTYIRNGQTYESGSTYAFEEAIAEALITHGAAKPAEPTRKKTTRSKK